MFFRAARGRRTTSERSDWPLGGATVAEPPSPSTTSSAPVSGARVLSLAWFDGARRPATSSRTGREGRQVGVRRSAGSPRMVDERYRGRRRARRARASGCGRGEVFGFLGPNGAGKTTTIRCCSTCIRPTSGGATLLGLDARPTASRCAGGSATFPGDLRLVDRLTGREQLDSLLRGCAVTRRPAPRHAVERLRRHARPADPRAVEGKPPEARARAGVHAPPGAAHPRRAHERPRSAPAGGVLALRARPPRRRTSLPLVPLARRGAARRRPPRADPRRAALRVDTVAALVRTPSGT